MNAMDLPSEALPDTRIRAEIGKLMAETVKLGAETAKMQRERAWYPVVLMTGALAAGAAFGAAFAKFL